MSNPTTQRLVTRRSIATAIVAFGMLGAAALPSFAQGKPAPTGSVLIFPAVIEGVSGDSAALAAEIVTDALRTRLKGLGTGVVVYSGRLPSVQRAKEEQQIRKEDVENGPADDRAKARRIADIVGASEYLSVFVDGYKYDSSSRTASFNLNVNRYLTADGSPVGSFSKSQQGMAPSGVAAGRQEGSALARAMEVGAEQGIGDLYPIATILENAKVAPRKGKQTSNRGIVTLFTAAIAALFQSTR
ncbi:MAG: hypothetical protein ACKO5K_02920 [Armatimonadota bacterium]